MSAFSSYSFKVISRMKPETTDSSFIASNEPKKNFLGERKKRKKRKRTGKRETLLRDYRRQFMKHMWPTIHYGLPTCTLG